MAAFTTVALVTAGIGAAMSAYGSAAQGNSAQIAGEYNAMMAERNAKLAQEKAAEDAKRFRVAMRSDQASNRARLGKSGVTFSGSAMDLLYSNASRAEEDAIAIKMGGLQLSDAYLNEARFSRSSGNSQSRAANIGAAANLLQSTGSFVNQYNRVS